MHLFPQEAARNRPGRAPTSAMSPALRTTPGRFIFCLTGIILAGTICGFLHAAPVDKGNAAHFADSMPGWIARYQSWDALHRDGIGRSDATASGTLGWSESGFLHRYMMCWLVTRDTYWLDKVIDHFDRMRAHLTDPDGDGFLSWRDIKYSVGLVDIDPQSGDGRLTVATGNGDRRVYVGKAGGQDITGHAYRIEFVAADRFRVVDTTANRVLATLPYRSGMGVDAIPGVKLRVRGHGRTGARFEIRTTAPQACEYQVHDGMVTYPVALFIEQVRRTPSLPARYRDKADEYLALLYKHFLLRWEKTWTDVPPQAGLYRFSENPTQRYPGYSLPHNQYLALGRTWLVLGRLKNFAGAALCAQRARKMARYFKRNLRVTPGKAYVWNYWDPLPGENIKPSVEDRSHATIDIDFAMEAARRGVVFNEEDLRRFARTYVDVMWNDDRENPLFGKRVDSSKGAGPVWWRWIQLGVVDQRIWDLAVAMFRETGHATTMVPSMSRLYDKRFGLNEAVRRQCRENTPRILTLARADELVNGGFEIPLPGATTPAGWELGRWRPDRLSEAEWVSEAYSGRRAVALIGRGETVNVWALSETFIQVAPPAKVTVTAWYRAGKKARAYMSILGIDAAGKRVQYESSTGFPAAAAWRRATWTLELKPNVRRIRIMVRNGGPGTVRWDEVKVTLAPLQ